MKLTLPLAALVCALVYSAATLAAAKTALECGQRIDVRTLQVIGASTILVDEGHITAVTPGFGSAPAGAEVVDLRDHVCMPGLMDMHVHLGSQYGPRTYVERFQLNPADYALRSVRYVERTLLAGFTTVRDLGARDDLNVSLKRAIERGWIPGPRVYSSAKSIATTGGHADPTNGVRSTLMGDPGPKQGVINGVEDARKAVRQRYKDGADLIKITATGGVLSVAASGQNPQFSAEELAAIIETASDYGFHVAAHAHGTEGMKRAVRAGVHSIEHGTYMDEETMKLMRKRGTWYVPTIMAGKWVAEKSEIDGFFPAAVRPKAARIGPQIQDTFARAYRAGVKIAFGTDTGVSAHGDNALEFEYMVEAGMPVLEAIQSATLSGAQLLGIEDRLGTLEPGKLADVVAVRDDPRNDVTTLRRPSFVMKQGSIYKRPATPNRP
jgi:imidazolonepropionase-like amidohydrolase